ncbi:MAG: hypothetical protein Phyf2KO_12100 [Phycisphaerales bacterium]
MRFNECRSKSGRFRPILTTVVVTVLLTLGWVGLEVYFAWSSKPAIQENYGAKIREIAEAWQPGTGPNGWDSLVRACEAHREHVESYYDEKADWQGRTSGILADAVLQPEWTRDFLQRTDELEQAEADRLVSVLQGWVLETIDSFDSLGISEELDELCQTDVFLGDWPDSTAEEQFEPYWDVASSARGLLRMLDVKMYLHAERGEWEEYLRTYEHVFALGRAFRFQPGILGSHLGMAAHEKAARRFRSDLLQARIPISIVEQIFELEPSYTDGPTLAEIYQIELLVYLDIHQKFFDARGRLVVTRMLNLKNFLGGKAHWTENFRAITMPRWKTVKMKIEEQHAQKASFAMSPPASRLDHKRESYEVMPLFDESLPLVERFTRGMSSLPFTLGFDTLSVSAPGHRMLVAIELYRFATGESPVELGDLVPGYLEEVPIDSFHPDGMPWNYKRLDQPDEFGRTYILYSVGRDGSDNGGAHHETSASHALDPKNAGTDYVMNHPSLYKTD